jgi:hypothetical protein
MPILELNKIEINNIQGGISEYGIIEGIKRWVDKSKKEIYAALDKFFNNSNIIIL